MKRLRWITAALAAPLFLAGQAMADVDYGYVAHVTATNPSPADFATTAVTFNDGDGLNLINSSPIDIAGVHVVQTAPTSPLDTGSVTITDTITVNQSSPLPGGMNTFVVVGTIQFNGNNGPSTFTLDAGASTLTMMIGSTTYTLGSFNYSVPTVNGTDGALGGFVTVSVSEPTSMALVAVGGLLFAAPRLRRLVRRIGQSS
jgi:hypothetical protein